MFSVIVYETSNSAAENAFKAVQNYISPAKLPGLTLGEVTQIPLDSSKKFLTVDDGKLVRLGRLALSF